MTDVGKKKQERCKNLGTEETNDYITKLSCL